jgi:hypothetical protein
MWAFEKKKKKIATAAGFFSSTAYLSSFNSQVFQCNISKLWKEDFVMLDKVDDDEISDSVSTPSTFFHSIKYGSDWRPHQFS